MAGQDFKEDYVETILLEDLKFDLFYVLLYDEGCFCNLCLDYISCVLKFDLF